MLNKYGYEIKNNKDDLENILIQARNKYGDILDVLDFITVSSVKSMVKDENFQYFVGDEQDDLTVTHVYRIMGSSMWSGYLTGLLLEWYTDEDFESGLFEALEMTHYEYIKTINQLKALNKIMKEYNDTNWDFKASDKRINELENILN